MAPTRKKTVLTVKKEYLALKDLQKDRTKKSVVLKVSVPQNTLTYWIKHKEEIISKYEYGQFGRNVLWIYVNEMYQLVDTLFKRKL